MVQSKSGSLEVTLRGDNETILTRTFNAPAALVFEAWTKPEHVRQWWGLRASTMTVCEIDFRVGGRWRFVTTDSDDGSEVAFSGEYREIEAPSRIVNTEAFELFPDNPSVVTNIFEEHDGRTTLTQICEYDSPETRQLVMESGMEFGAGESMDRLEELLERLGS